MQVKRVFGVGLVLLAISVVFVMNQAWAHGSVQEPKSRAYNCFLEGPESPTSLACQAALAVGGSQPFYDWHEINLNADGQHQALIPDGQLCSAGREKYAGVDLPRADWPAETIVPDANGNFEFVYHAAVPHSTAYFKFYVTKDGYDPTQPLAWADLEEFCTITDVTLEGMQYRMSCPLPAKNGRHVIYNIWQRDDSPEAFYSCSDVIFGEDNSPTPTATVPSGACEAQAWSTAVAYTQNQIVSHHGVEWQAKWWTQGEEPGTTGEWGVWLNLGACGVSTPAPTPTLPATALPTAEPTVALPTATPDSSTCTAPHYVAGTTYATGQQVQNVGNLYQCTVGGWCSSAGAWAYEPGVGSYWQDAWTSLGVCH